MMMARPFDKEESVTALTLIYIYHYNIDIVMTK